LEKNIRTLRAKVNTILCVHKNAFTKIWKNLKNSISSVRILKELLNFSIQRKMTSRRSPKRKEGNKL
jgi:hypothetical protein